MRAHPKWAATFVQSLEQRTLEVCRKGKNGVRELATSKSVMSFASLMTTMHHYSDHWDTWFVCIVVLTTLSKSEQKLEFTTTVHKRKSCLFRLNENIHFLYLPWEFSMFRQKYVDLIISRRYVFVSMFMESKFCFNRVIGKILELFLKRSEMNTLLKTVIVFFGKLSKYRLCVKFNDFCHFLCSWSQFLSLIIGQIFKINLQNCSTQYLLLWIVTYQSESELFRNLPQNYPKSSSSEIRSIFCSSSYKIFFSKMSEWPAECSIKYKCPRGQGASARTLSIKFTSQKFWNLFWNLKVDCSNGRLNSFVEEWNFKSLYVYSGYKFRPTGSPSNNNLQRNPMAYREIILFIFY